MKCPKCGYHSFEYLERCRKCGNDLAAFKAKFNLRSLIFPKRQGASPVPAVAVEDFAFEAEQPAPVAAADASAPAANATDFGFDFMEETPVANERSQAPATAESPFLDEIAIPAGKEAFDTEAFDWNAEDDELKEATGGDEVEDAVDTAAGDENFGLDLSWDAELPVLEQASAEPEDPSDPLDMDSLSDWDFEGEAPVPEAEPVKAKGQEAPRDPFEVREPGMESPVPEVDLQTLSPASPPPVEMEEEPATAAMTSTITAGVAHAATEILPAAAPEDAVAAKGNESKIPPLLPRALALGVDLLILGGVILLFLVAGERALAPVDSGRLLPSFESLLRLAIPYFLVGFSLSFGYFTLFHFLVGQTPGKMLWRLRVETEDGSPLDLPQAFLRSTGGLFALLAGGLGFLGILSARRRGWNDRFAGTRVVAARPEDNMPE